MAGFVANCNHFTGKKKKGGCQRKKKVKIKRPPHQNKYKKD